jgi:hypothetical protein
MGKKMYKSAYRVEQDQIQRCKLKFVNKTANWALLRNLESAILDRVLLQLFDGSTLVCIRQLESSQAPLFRPERADLRHVAIVADSQKCLILFKKFSHLVKEIPFLNKDLK